jgi:hypothetical protein
VDTEVELLIEAQCLAFEVAPTPLIARAVHTLLFTNGGTVEDLYRLCPSVTVFNALTQVLGQYVLDVEELRANGGRLEPLPGLRVVH